MTSSALTSPRFSDWLNRALATQPAIKLADTAPHATAEIVPQTPVGIDAASVSPSLRSQPENGRQAFEVKFALTPQQACEVQARLAPRMTLDPHADIRLGGCYSISSLYTDTTAFDAYHRRGRLRSTKFRMRQYDATGSLFVEQKNKRQQLVSKRRAIISSHELPQLQHVESLPDWNADWFRQELLHRELHPVCRVSYLRKAFFASSETGPVRLTFDSHLQGSAATGWDLATTLPASPFAQELVICEFKFTVAMPTLFRAVVEELRLTPGSFSKYRRCVDMLGLCPVAEVARV